MPQQNQTLFETYRQRYPIFTYEKYQFDIDGARVNMKFAFRVGDEFVFTPQMSLDPGKYGNISLKSKEIEGLVFHIGMIELISYWKCVCSPTVLIIGRKLTEKQQAWWKKLYWKGLGEFFYQNGITSTSESFLQFEFSEGSLPIDEFEYHRVEESSATVVPIGGGKDSVVTLEHLRKEKTVVPFIINPRGATLECARIAGFPHPEDIVILRRQIDAKLLELNSQGYLNGHTPFSAMLAFHSLLVSAAVQVRDIALSNESSANEPTIPGTEINHQYSKSLEFEKDFRCYVKENMGDCAHYFSYLRPYTELQIASFFARYPAYFPVFKSCNAGSKTDIWCCNCPKCLFAYIILSPYIDDETMIRIFGEDLLDKPSLVTYFEELTGMAEVKPFECVGTIDEVNRALAMLGKDREEKFLVKHWLSKR